MTLRLKTLLAATLLLALTAGHTETRKKTTRRSSGKPPAVVVQSNTDHKIVDGNTAYGWDEGGKPATDDSAAAGGKKTNNPQQLPINLKADSGEYDANTGVATYNGHVVITQGEMNLKGDRVTIRLQDGKIHTIESWGNPTTFHYVPAKEPPIDGSGNHMKYTVPTSTVEINKNARVKQEKNETRADHLTYNLKSESVKGRGVNMTFQPKTK
mgnify:CR=1 FL=1